MRRIFVDTQGWIALKYRSDHHFQQARQVFNKALYQKALFTTTDFVLDETYTFLRRTAGHLTAVGFGEEVRAMPVLRIVHIGKKFQEAAWNLFRSRDESLSWSFTDCTSFVVMQQLDILEALTNDHEFEQAGFVKLLHS